MAIRKRLWLGFRRLFWILATFRFKIAFSWVQGFDSESYWWTIPNRQFDSESSLSSWFLVLCVALWSRGFGHPFRLGIVFRIRIGLRLICESGLAERCCVAKMLKNPFCNLVKAMMFKMPRVATFLCIDVQKRHVLQRFKCTIANVTMIIWPFLFLCGNLFSAPPTNAKKTKQKIHKSNATKLTHSFHYTK